MIRGVLFDFDGTLIDPYHARLDALSVAIQKIAGVGMSSTDLRKILFGDFSGLKSRVGSSQADKIIETAAEHYQQNTIAPLYPGIKEMFEAFEARGLTFSLVTTRDRKRTIEILEGLGMKEKFIKIVAGDDRMPTKPAPHGILAATEAMRLDESEVIFIGDSWVDIVAAQKAQVKAVAALWNGLDSKKELQHYWPDYWAETPKKFVTIVDMLSLPLLDENEPAA